MDTTKGHRYLTVSAHGRPAAMTAPPVFRDRPQPLTNTTQTPSLAGYTVLLVGRSQPDMRQMSIWVDGFGGVGVNTAMGKTALDWLAQPTRGRAMVVVDGDDIGDAEEVVDFGYALRKVAPDAPVILLSSFFKRNDFTSERMLICDASLRNPVSLVTFKLGVAAALQNHQIYQRAVRPALRA